MCLVGLQDCTQLHVVDAASLLSADGGGQGCILSGQPGVWMAWHGMAAGVRVGCGQHLRETHVSGAYV